MTRGKLATAIGLLALLVAPAAGAASAAAAEQPVDSWAAWHGCWSAADAAGTQGQLVCVLPGAAANAVRIVTLEDDAVVDETVVTADGVARRVEDGGCAGTERAHWSRDGRRVFLRTELDCNGVRRLSTGVLAVTSENEWVDVQAVSVGDGHASRTIRYRAVRSEDVPASMAAQLPTGRELARESSRLNAAAPLDLAAVVEASAELEAPAVEALLAAGQYGFSLDGRTIAQLERQGVAPSTIDVLVALSHPEVFAVRTHSEEASFGTGWAHSRAGVPIYCLDRYYSDIRYRSECARYYGVGRYSRYGGSYFGYSPWGYDPYGWSYGRGPAVIIVRPRDEAREERGNVVKGRGYTRGGSAGTGRAAPRSGDQGGARSQPARGSDASSTARPSTDSSDRGSDRSTEQRPTARPRSGGGQ